MTDEIVRGRRKKRVQDARDTITDLGAFATWDYEQWKIWRQNNVDPEIIGIAPNTVTALNGLVEITLAQRDLILELLDFIERKVT